ncbi:hypothetical protein [Enterovibrio nigricans]|uniref:Uncharacterized protein n=1 Tax=Enterovibrio nigricans DSM 22720 TaxID=1121868 RepID=A0A1T4VVF5_9GAMM|nr:hypothetical protein [Enterovibrio nigricans]PKF49236.1 hypothetical protein AT251_20380 [Enterovibrio nigricans]SKA68936.1 hypothetical protein SAMN02745132_04373 [Enterovibrio nigricans DSM 22720]
MTESMKTSRLWMRAKSVAKQVRENGLGAIVGVVTFSLFFMMGLVTLGACLLAGVAAVIIAKWHEHKAKNDVANPANNVENDPIVAA